MKKPIKIILIVSGLYGISIGIFDFLFPIYLDFIKITFKNMGWIFAISFIFIFFFRIYLGHISDFIGRKLFYGLSLITGAISQNLSPLFTSFFPLTFLKTIREISLATRENFQPVVVYETGKEKFLDFIAKTNGLSFFLEGIGILIAGYLLIKINVKISLLLSAIPVWSGVFIFY
ncbi:hypothetical protein J7L87_05160, partial [bacterium]|nr:hypothetical protein [bacterium]